MENNTLRKRRFLCFDLTPRWKMWKRIADLEEQAAIYLLERNGLDRNLFEQDRRVRKLIDECDTLYKRIDELEGSLRKFDRTRGKSGKYIKGHETRSSK